MDVDGAHLPVHLYAFASPMVLIFMAYDLAIALLDPCLHPASTAACWQLIA